MKQLKTAIETANRAGILMFCSASDQGANSNGHCYPGAWNQCIRIGGATFTGEKLTWVDDDIDFSLPGRNVPFPSKDGKSIVYESGSSVATAAASGLAGVSIYSARLLNANNPEYKANIFEDRIKMTTAFRNMAAKGADRKFPQTDRILNKTFKKNIMNVIKKSRTIDIETLSWSKGDREFKALEDLLNQLQVV
ncbi:hypothetical protein DID88_010289 [Monilinia fructigena]|uniref:Peptidase S8/S53 domain-containing protein n=1 Tax=Monilinia fructigena TaxID=38457 RepID=A0A395ILQ7_9HELO|nr:hypothetical protein DID88_010289 [Monilinia fructigena]